MIMNTQQDRLAKLKKTRATVNTSRTKAGDYVYDGVREKWMTVTRLLWFDGHVYCEGELPSGKVVLQDSQNCFPSWNPRHRCFGRAEGETRTKYWHA